MTTLDTRPDETLDVRAITLEIAAEGDPQAFLAFMGQVLEITHAYSFTEGLVLSVAGGMSIRYEKESAS